MRAAPAAIVFSVAVHTAAVAWVTSPGHTPVTPLPVSVAVTVPAPEPPLMVVELLEDPREPTVTPAAGGSHGGAAPPHRDRPRVAISTGTTGIVETARPGAPPAPPAPSAPPKTNLLTMRRPQVDLRPSSELLDEFLSRSPPVAPARAVGDEGARAQIAMARSKLGDPSFMERATGDEIRVERERLASARGEADAVDLHPTGKGTYGSNQDVFKAHIDADGTAHLKDEPNVQLEGLSIRFDVTDWQMRSHGIDPYASRKLAFLDRTRDQRVEIGRRFRNQQLAQSAALMQRNLERLAATTGDLAARKQALFELWDECAETGDAELVTAGAAARGLVVGFIRAKLRGAEAYTAGELVQLNAHRHSKRMFAPYE